MIRHPERVKAERLRPLSEGEEVCPARSLASQCAFDGRQVNANFERAQGPRRRIHTCLGGPGRLLVISHDDSPYLLFDELEATSARTQRKRVSCQPRLSYRLSRAIQLNRLVLYPGAHLSEQ